MPDWPAEGRSEDSRHAEGSPGRIPALPSGRGLLRTSVSSTSLREGARTDAAGRGRQKTMAVPHSSLMSNMRDRLTEGARAAAHRVEPPLGRLIARPTLGCSGSSVMSAKSSRCSGGPTVGAIQQATESRTAVDAATRAIVIRQRHLGSGESAAEPLVIALGVLVADEFLDQAPKVPRAEDDEVVQTLGSNREDETLGEGVAVRAGRPDVCSGLRGKSGIGPGCRDSGEMQGRGGS